MKVHITVHDEDQGKISRVIDDHRFRGRSALSLNRGDVFGIGGVGSFVVLFKSYGGAGKLSSIHVLQRPNLGEAFRLALMITLGTQR